MLNDEPSRLILPPVPDHLATAVVAAWSEPVTIDTYPPAQPDLYPAFLDTRVYQGSSGRVFPLPFHERIEQVKRPREWQAIHLENEWVRLVILPELGGRIHVGYDKVAGYDFFYRNNVIKPALVGLAGPWMSGGVEFNWPQHHRPATFLPTDVHIEHEPDGAVTVWCSDHDPITRMKGMHGIRLRPDRSVIEARVRLYNRTETTQTFLWWANVAAAVNDDYQSFFPTDVHFVADHAKRAVATFPAVDGDYYGVDYPSRVGPEAPDADRLDWYRNIPVPTSYMVTSTADDFFGGYDHGREAGFVYWADHTVAPGKKQWTWGNAEFGQAWDANLTDDDGPYIELMAGAFTDNQPDFSFLAPGETKSFSQYWFPIQQIGVVQQANLDAAVSLTIDDGFARVGVAATRVLADAIVTLRSGDEVVQRFAVRIEPGEPFVERMAVTGDGPFSVHVTDAGAPVIEWTTPPETAVVAPAPATEPPAPAETASSDELFLTGQYLEQYRHATRAPEPYWREALRRDPGDWRSNTALAARLQAAARFADAETHLRAAIDRLVARVPNPADGEAHYRLGLVLAHTGRDSEAIEALAKSAWDQRWRSAAAYEEARLLSRRGDLAVAARRLTEALAVNAEHSQARALLVRVLREVGYTENADRILGDLLRADPLDQWARDLASLPLTADAPTLLDVALEYSAAGFDEDALRLLDLATAASARTALGQVQVGPLVHYHRAAVLDGLGEHTAAESAREAARSADLRWCLPSRLEDVATLEAALVHGPDAVASALLGSWYYDKERFDDAIAAWRAATVGPLAVIAHRNLGIAAVNVLHDTALALDEFEHALALAPADAKLLYEFDQLQARAGESAALRLGRLEARLDLVLTRDDLTVVLATLLTGAGRAGEARAILADRRFQPWEGGEGQVLAAWTGALSALAHAELDAGRADAAVALVRDALRPPSSLGEARHPLANVADLQLLLGDALAAARDTAGARDAWRMAADAQGDFAGMSVQAYSEQSLHSIAALRRIGEDAQAAELERRVGAFADRLAATPATVDFFATSLPSMLLFHHDPQDARTAQVAALRAGLPL